MGTSIQEVTLYHYLMKLILTISLRLWPLKWSYGFLLGQRSYANALILCFLRKEQQIIYHLRYIDRQITLLDQRSQLSASRLYTLQLKESYVPTYIFRTASQLSHSRCDGECGCSPTIISIGVTLKFLLHRQIMDWCVTSNLNLVSFVVMYVCYV